MCATKSLVHAVYTKSATKSLVHAAYTLWDKHDESTVILDWCWFKGNTSLSLVLIQEKCLTVLMGSQTYAGQLSTEAVAFTGLPYS